MNRSLAVSLPNLIEHMRDVAARTFDPGLRYHNEPDAVLYGKAVMLETLAEPHYSSSDLTEDEEQALMSAAKELGRAFDHLAAIVFPQGDSSKTPTHDDAVSASHGIFQLLCETAFDAIASGNRSFLEWRIRPMENHLKTVIGFLEGKEAE